MHVGGLHGQGTIFSQKPSAFDYGIDGLCKGGARGSCQLEDRSREPSR
jgi:hypothetical protein